MLTGLWIFAQALFYVIVFVAIPLVVIGLTAILIWSYIQHKMGVLHHWKDITNRKISNTIVWADDFREICNLFYENPDDPFVHRLFQKSVMESMPMLSDDYINPRICELTGFKSWLLKEQLKVNLNHEYYVKNWGDLPTKVDK